MEVSGVWVPISLFVSVAAVIGMVVYFHFRSRTEYQKTVRTVVERGQQLTPEFLERLNDGGREREEPRPSDRHGLRGARPWNRLVRAPARRE